VSARYYCRGRNIKCYDVGKQMMAGGKVNLHQTVLFKVCVSVSPETDVCQCHLKLTTLVNKEEPCTQL